MGVHDRTMKAAGARGCRPSRDGLICYGLGDKRHEGDSMTAPYTHKKLTDVKDSAPEFGFAEIQQARFAGKDLDAEDTGVSLHRLMPGKRQAFAHRHENAEEIYVVLGGSGRMKLDEEIIELGSLDAIRVSPHVVRAFEGGPEGMELLAFGPHHDGDGEVIQQWWTD
jgi:mannose-6-phosphate isomerase-like protein (cupin superfamily)